MPTLTPHRAATEGLAAVVLWPETLFPEQFSRKVPTTMPEAKKPAERFVEELANFKTRLAKNPNYFGNLAEGPLKRPLYLLTTKRMLLFRGKEGVFGDLASTHGTSRRKWSTRLVTPGFLHNTGHSLDNEHPDWINELLPSSNQTKCPTDR